MKLILACVFVAVLAGYLARGRLANLAALEIRWLFLAPLGLGLELVPASSRILSLTLLFLSFVALSILVLANIRVSGFAFVLVGLALNLLVISANRGMPVTQHALVASGQGASLSILMAEGGAKHHLASSSDVLLPLADVIPTPVVDQVLKRTDADLRLGGAEVEGTVLFTDLRGFTSASEHLSAERVLKLINRHLEEIVDAVMSHGRHARLLHRRRDHGRLRSADRAAGPRPARVCGRARDGRGKAPALEPVAA